MNKWIKFVTAAVVLVCTAVLSACGGILPVSLVNTQEISLENVDFIGIYYSSDNVTVFTGDGDTLVVKEFMGGSGSSNYHADILSRDGSVTIRAGRRPVTRMWNSYVEIYLPESFEGDLAIHTSSGDIVINGSYSLGRLNLAATSGDIDVLDVSADTVSIVASSGDVSIGTVASSGILDIRTTSGDIDIWETEAAFIRLTASSGDIDAGRIAGEIEARTTSGDVEIAEANGFGSFSASSGNLDISFYNVNGDINANTTSGRITLTIPEAHTFNFSARTTSGSINVPFTGAENHGRRATTATVGENPEFTIDLSASSGNIRLLRCR